MAVEYFAPAKVNLALHVTGRRDDGYHELDSLVAFAEIGDWVRAEPSGELSLEVTGDHASGVPKGEDNLVLRAARLMGVNAAITLEKNLPAAAGLGGGSSDAAATLFALAELSGRPVPRERAVELGADVPVCLRGTRTRIRGIGEILEPAPQMPRLPAVLVNPGVVLSTPEVFAAFDGNPDPRSEIEIKFVGGPIEEFRTVENAAGWICFQRNDLQRAAWSLAPEVSDALQVIGACEECLLTRMSGSGATCFGVFRDSDATEAAAERIRQARPGWWVVPTTLS